MWKPNPDELHKKFLEKHTMQDLPVRMYFLKPYVKYMGVALLILGLTWTTFNLAVNGDPQFASCTICW